MASKGYSTVDQVASALGADFTPEQEALCDTIIEASERWIDQELGKAWLETGPIVERIYNPQGVYIRLKKAPVLTVTSVVVAGHCGDMALVEGMGYYVQDLQDGRLYMPYTMRTYLVTVTYEPNIDPVPPEVQLAAMTLAGANMRMMPTMFDGVDPSLIQRYNVGGELEVEFRKTLLSGGWSVPQQVMGYLDMWRSHYVIV